MEEKVLLDLGFEKINVSAEESGDKPYYYFEYRIDEVNFGPTLVTETSDEVENNCYNVWLDDYTKKYAICKTEEETKTLITTLEKK